MKDCKDCFLCNGKITRGEVLTRNDTAFAKVVMSPVASGQTIVGTGKHTTWLHELSGRECTDFINILREVSGIVHTNLKPKGTTIIINQGEVGQISEHLHANVIPIYSSDVMIDLKKLSGDSLISGSAVIELQTIFGLFK